MSTPPDEVFPFGISRDTALHNARREGADFRWRFPHLFTGADGTNPHAVGFAEKLAAAFLEGLQTPPDKPA